MKRDSYIRIRGLTKCYGDIKILDNLKLKIRKGSFLGIFGPNGCGKTTLLKIVGGIENPDKGEILVNSNSHIKKRIGFINQNYKDTLMPWLNCLENILLPYTLNSDEEGKSFAIKKLKILSSKLGISLPLENYPYQLSGGQQQLTVILRAVLYRSDILLLDEPFSSLDVKTQGNLRKVLKSLWKEEDLTILFVSHNIDDLFYFNKEIIFFDTKTKNVKIVRKEKREFLKLTKEQK